MKCEKRLFVIYLHVFIFTRLKIKYTNSYTYTASNIKQIFTSQTFLIPTHFHLQNNLRWKAIKRRRKKSNNIFESSWPWEKWKLSKIKLQQCFYTELKKKRRKTINEKNSLCLFIENQTKTHSIAELTHPKNNKKKRSDSIV